MMINLSYSRIVLSIYIAGLRSITLHKTRKVIRPLLAIFFQRGVNFPPLIFGNDPWTQKLQHEKFFYGYGAFVKFWSTYSKLTFFFEF